MVATQITLAATNIDAMVRFYTAVLGIELRPVDAYGTTLYRGALHGVSFVLCPNSLAGVQAEKSRHQFTYAVADLAATVAGAVAAGGAVDEAAQGNADSATLLDPDGNSIVFVQAEG
jgi:predicted enzyme related to lactoylglutathione lyase